MTRRDKHDPRLEDYKRVRKPVPPPERVERDRRKDMKQREAAREVDETLLDEVEEE